MKKLYGRRTSSEFERFFSEARSRLKKPVKFTDSRKLEGRWKDWRAKSRETESGITVWINASLPQDRIERLACHELGHSLLIQDGYPRIVFNSQKVDDTSNVADISTVLYCGLADVLIDERLPEKLSLIAYFQEEIDQSWSLLEKEQPKEESAGEVWPHVLGMYLKAVLSARTFRNEREYLAFLRELRPKTAEAAQDIANEALKRTFRTVDGFWATAEFGLDRLQIPHVGLASPLSNRHFIPDHRW